MNKMSLRTKGLLLIVLISFIPLLLAGLANYFIVKEEMTDSAKAKLTSKLQTSASSLASWLAIRRAEVLVMSRTDAVRFGTDEERVNYFSRELVRSGFTYSALGFVNPAGNSIRTNGSSINVSEQPFFKEAIRGKVGITDPFVPYFETKQQVYIVAPVYGEQNEITGIIYAAMKLTTVESMLTMRRQTPGSFYIINRSGEMIYSSRQETVAEDMAAYKKELAPSSNDQEPVEQSGSFVMRQNGFEHIVFYEKVDSVTGWRFAQEVPLSVLHVGLTRVLLQTLATIALAEIVVVVLFFIFFASIVRRLEAILAVTEQAADGRFDAVHLNELPSDEVGKLASSVNGMMEHLKDMFEQLGAIINQNQYAFIVLDDQYRVTYMNSAAEQLIGYQLEEIRGHGTPLLFIDPDEISYEAEQLSMRLGRTVSPGLELFQELRTEQFNYEREWTFIHKDGTKIPVRHSSNGLRDQHGKFTGVVGMAYDISEQQQVERSRNRLLDIVGSAQDLIASADHKGNIIYMNKAGRELLGLENDYKSTTIRRHMEARQFNELARGAMSAGRHGFWEGNAELYTSQMDKLYVSLIIVAHRNSRTGELFYSCIARDVTDQRHTHEKLILATQEAEEANAAKSKFLALMSHEIRTPLNGIIGLTQLMRRTGLSASQKDYMNKISTSSDTLLHIINDILDFSKIEAGKIETESLAFQPEDVLNRLAEQLSIFIGGKEQFEFIIDSPQELPATLLGDPMRLEQILLNLCMNAIKFTASGKVLFKIAVLKQEKDRATLQFAVEDTGIGMTREQLDKLFQPFTQADNSTTRKFGGTGLGLVITNSLVKMMGGSLKVESEYKKGSRFSFSLEYPVLPGPSAHAAGKQQGRERELLQEQSVWIVEDSDEMRKHWCDLVDSYGLTPVPFYSWKSAKERLMRVGDGAKPSLLLLDMEMPDMYGTETWLDFNRAANNAGVQTVVVTTSYGRDELLQMPSSERPSALLTKPVTRRALQQVLELQLEANAAQPSSPGLDKDQAAQEAAAAVSGSIIEPGAEGVRILLAEDNGINQLVAVDMLKNYGFEVDVAENGRQVINMLEQNPRYPIILMDIHMPVMDGMEATRLIRSDARYNHIPIIAVTANTLRSDHEQYLNLGMSGVVTKPIHQEELYTVIAQSLSLPLPLNQPFELAKRGAKAQPDILLPVVAGIDMQAVLDRVSGKHAIVLHMLEQFENEYGSFMDRLHEQLNAGQLGTVKRMLHTLKGASSHLSAVDIANAAAALEAVVKREPLDEQEWNLAAEQLENKLSITIQSLQSR
ncbi:response regulator [Paenibacillus sp. NEAU-GSW1]|uniref:response regulator n=1 Tax=Paenibacillus sp. NEAU-GSW1 TaxID=2682486 RepID=UPI0012E13674|nr:response regulator [Paenibacillus sp. NEAU-GSW1]MUT66065.1 response regulator [Paenibacillus sp. NEAU-GSW1]